MELLRYRELKDKGAITIQKIGEAYAVVTKQYDPMTGDATCRRS